MTQYIGCDWDDEKVKKFKSEVEAFCEDEIGKIIDDEAPNLADEIAKYIRDKALEIMEREIVRWQNGGILTLNHMELEIKNSIEVFFNGDEYKKKIENIATSWFWEQVVSRIEQKIAGICSKFDIVYQNLFVKYMEAARRVGNKITDGKPTSDISPMGEDAIQELFLKFDALLPAVLTTIISKKSSLIVVISYISAIIAHIIFGVLGAVPAAWSLITAIVAMRFPPWLWNVRKDEVIAMIQEFNFPQNVRNCVRVDRIRRELNDKKSEIYDEIYSGIKKNEQICCELRGNVASSAGKIVQEVTKQITFDLNR